MDLFSSRIVHRTIISIWIPLAVLEVRTMKLHPFLAYFNDKNKLGFMLYHVEFTELIIVL